MYNIGRKNAQRIEAWRNCLKRMIYTPLGSVSLEMGQAPSGDFVPAPQGTKWGLMREYRFFRGTVSPKGCPEGSRLVLFCNVGGESLIFVNGQAAGSVDKKHEYVTLTRHSRPGDTFDLLIEAYAGNGPRLENFGPCPAGIDPVPDVTKPQAQVGNTFVALWNEEIYQLHLDVEVLCGLLPLLPEHSLRAQKVAQALVDFTHLFDPELPATVLPQSVQKARDALKPALECTNGSTAPCLHLIGQSHIDLAWLWPFEETRHKVCRTYANQLALMDEYPEYNFLVCEPPLLEMLREMQPELYDRMKEKVQAGQGVADGAFYVECDTNIPSGESLIRQFLWGKRWFEGELGVTPCCAWQPDTFGFSAALPQIMKGFGIDYFATQKLLRADPECEQFPYQNFIWEGLDGSRVQALSFFKANAEVTPKELVKRWETDRTQNSHIDTLLYPFGFGDGGGGAIRDMPEMLRRMKNLEGLPKTRYGTLREYFELSAQSAAYNVHSGELYLNWHRGTYSVQHQVKALLRRAEGLLHDLEMLVCLQGKGQDYYEKLHDHQRVILLHTFHDVAAGVSVECVRKEAEETLQGLCADMQTEISCLMNDSPEEALVYYNPLPWERTIRSDKGNQVYKLPPCGVSAPVPVREEGNVRLTRQGDEMIVENSLMRFSVSNQGEITALYDKRNGLDLMKKGQKMNALRLYKNVECVYDAWELSPDYRDVPAQEPEQVVCTGVNELPGCVQITFAGRIGNSPFTQTLALHGQSDQIDLSLHIDWQETHKMLKLTFESNIFTQDVLCETQFGFLRRPCRIHNKADADKFEMSTHRWCALCEADRGLAVLNDSVYGLSAREDCISMTLLRSPVVPDKTVDRGCHDFGFAILPLAVPFGESNVLQRASEMNTPVYPGHTNPVKGYWAQGAVLETIKQPEDLGASNQVILRLYEPFGRTGKCILHLPEKKQLFLCDLQEQKKADLGLSDTFELPTRPFGIMTVMAL